MQARLEVRLGGARQRGERLRAAAVRTAHLREGRHVGRVLVHGQARPRARRTDRLVGRLGARIGARAAEDAERADHLLGVRPGLRDTGDATLAVALGRGDLRLHAGVGLLLREIGEEVAGLEAARDPRVVDQREVEDGLDRRVAGTDLRELDVIRRLLRLADRDDVLRRAVVRGLVPRHDSLLARLVHVDRQPLRCGEGRRCAAGLLGDRRLARAVERIPERLLDAIEVRSAGLRPLELLREWVRVLDGRIRMEVELVEDRLRPSRRLVGVTHVLDEPHGRVARVRRRVCVVVAARRDRGAPDDRIGSYRLQRVVRLRERVLVVGRRCVLAVHILRLPEAIDVRFVADDQVLHGRERLADEANEGRELRLHARVRADRGRVQRIDREDRPDVVQQRAVDRQLQI